MEVAIAMGNQELVASVQQPVMKGGTWHGGGVGDLALCPAVSSPKVSGPNPQYRDPWPNRMVRECGRSSVRAHMEVHASVGQDPFLLLVRWQRYTGQGICSAVSLLNATFNKGGV